jgi:hypothetical protein
MMVCCPASDSGRNLEINHLSFAGSLPRMWDSVINIFHAKSETLRSSGKQLVGFNLSVCFPDEGRVFIERFSSRLSNPRE